MGLKLVFVIFLLESTIFIACGQEIKLNIVSFNPCDSTFENERLAVLVKDNKSIGSDSVGTFLLSETGEYRLSSPRHSPGYLTTFYRLKDTVKYIKVHSGQNYDTLAQNTIWECLVVVADGGGPCGYLCCNKPCEGYKADYFDNGQKKIEGNFKNGFPVGQLILYHPDGRKKEIQYYGNDGQGRLIKKELVNKR